MSSVIPIEDQMKNIQTIQYTALWQQSATELSQENARNTPRTDLGTAASTVLILFDIWYWLLKCKSEGTRLGLSSKSLALVISLNVQSFYDSF